MMEEQIGHTAGISGLFERFGRIPGEVSFCDIYMLADMTFEKEREHHVTDFMAVMIMVAANAYNYGVMDGKRCERARRKHD